MTYQEAYDYLLEKLPMFQRVGKAAYKADLNNTQELDKILNHPHRHFRSIHIAGTNGKGSVAHLLASVLQSAGHKTGLYTSPHLKDFRERIKINGLPIPKTNVVAFIEKYKNDFDKIDLSFFEMTVGLAFEYFKNENVDAAVIETGMGGRLDSTNIITPEISIITNISFDHTAFLGNNLTSIATEKAGIIKPEVPVVVGEFDREVNQVFEQKATDLSTRIYYADQNYAIESVEEKENTFYLTINYSGAPFLSDLELPLKGYYQLKNTLTTIQSIEILRQAGFNITEFNIKCGFQRVIEQTGFHGRWQILKTDPLVICDTAHNKSGMEQIIKQILTLEYSSLRIVLGMVNDKQTDEILMLLPQKANYYFCQPGVPRAMSSNQLKNMAMAHNLRGKDYNTVKLALEQALKESDRDDLIFIGGSTFVVAEIV